MITPVVQRWRDRRGAYRPVGEPIRTSSYSVAELLDDTRPRAFVERHHYAGSYVAARWRFGLYRAGELVGVAVYSHPSNDKAITNFLPGAATDSVELGRLVLLDQVPANGESWFVARTFELLRREGLVGVLSFADPMPRTTLDGRVVMPGHIGNVYQALNAVYAGRATPRTLKLLPDGRSLNERSRQKTRKGERGASTVERELIALGAPRRTVSESRAGWLSAWTAALTRSIRHPGNHRYLWALDRRARRRLPASLPYPKFDRGPTP